MQKYRRAAHSARQCVRHQTDGIGRSYRRHTRRELRARRGRGGAEGNAPRREDAEGLPDCRQRCHHQLRRNPAARLVRLRDDRHLQRQAVAVVRAAGIPGRRDQREGKHTRVGHADRRNILHQRRHDHHIRRHLPVGLGRD